MPIVALKLDSQTLRHLRERAVNAPKVRWKKLAKPGFGLRIAKD
jgi:hypothetical protein